MSNSSTAVLPVEDEIIARLRDLADAHDRGDDGVSRAEMARDLHVSRQHVSALLKGDVRFRVEYIPLLRPRARNVVLGAIAACSAPASADDSVHALRRALSGMTHSTAVVAEIVEDDTVSPREETTAELELMQRRAQIDAVLSGIARRRAERANVVPIGGSR
jgi:hypothetical protein